MNDYKELIEELRDFSKQIELDDQRYDIPYGIYHEETLDKAADAIEYLVREYNELDKVHDEMFLELFADCNVCKNNNDECLNNGLCKACSVGKSTREYWELRGVTDE